MKTMLSIKNLLILILVLFLVPAIASAATMTNYCQAPPLNQAIPPNIMLVVDVSGSMSWEAYSYQDNTDAKNNFTGAAGADDLLDGYDPTKGYEGYFDPSKFYEEVYYTATDSYWKEVPGGTGISCTCACAAWSCKSSNIGGCDNKGTHGCSNSRYACCSAKTCTGDCLQNSGNYLNYKHMARIDLVRWAMTGGKPRGCPSTSPTSGYCDPEVWADSGNATKIGSVCNDSLDVDEDGTADGGCILITEAGVEVKVRWDRVYSGMTYQFMKLPTVPKLGAMFYEGSGVRADKVYLGDFTNANSKSTQYPFINLITLLNSQKPGGMTPTGPALWDAYNYFAQNPPKYGGFPEMSGSGDKWKNPMYVCANGGVNCSFVPCASNFLILMSDGLWNQGGYPVTGSCSIDTGYELNSADPVVPAYKMHRGFVNAKTTPAVKTNIRGIYPIGLFLEGAGQLAMQNIAMYGSFDTSSKTWPDSLTDYPKTSCNVSGDNTCSTAKGSPCAPLPASSPDWDNDGNNLPDTFYSASTAEGIKETIMDAILDILSHTSSGTAASVLASGEGSGATLIQAIYYPRRQMGADTAITWTGDLQALWYYVDPLFNNSSIREDGKDASGVHDMVLNLKTAGATQKDYITQFYFDSGLGVAMANRWTDDNGDASIVGETKLPPMTVDNTSSIWEAGERLWYKYYTTRSIYTPNLTGVPNSTNLMAFSCTPTTCPNAAVLAPYLDAIDPATGLISQDVAQTLMLWVEGVDYPTSPTYVPTYRKRLAKIGAAQVPWKLGDIINSTPKISTWQPLNDYNMIYEDETYGPLLKRPYQSEPPDTKYFITTYRYKGRGLVYTGANDGMLHAFRLGLMQLKWAGQNEDYEKSKFTGNVCSNNTAIYCSDDAHCASGGTCTASATSLGDEAWSFIPKNVLPYLKYLTQQDYCHLYLVDLTPHVFDASIGYPAGCLQTNYYDCTKLASTWRTVLIGGMRLGGACRDQSSTCTNCIKTPIQDPGNPAKGLGYSSYFALDLTDQLTPKLLWEYDGTVKNADGTYTNKLGLSSSGPAIIRINSTLPESASQKRNGRWFVVLGSGPTGPIDTATQQFLGKSDQNLTYHIFDLATGPGTDNKDVVVVDTGVPRAFSGTLTNSTEDLYTLKGSVVGMNYSDDVLYTPYVAGGPDVSYTYGGIGRLVTYESLDPNQWRWSYVVTNAGPITAAVATGKTSAPNVQGKQVWIFFGAGRYFYDRVIDSDDPDPVKRRQLFGVKENCLNSGKTAFLAACPAPIQFCDNPNDVATCGGLTNVTDVAVSSTITDYNASTYKGWYVVMDPADTAPKPGQVSMYRGERVITDAVTDSNGVVYFTSFKPFNDPCALGGATHIWAMDFATGGSVASILKGQVLIQVSTGSIEQVDLSKAFVDAGGRKSSAINGRPPMAQGMTIFAAPQPVKKVVHIKEN